MKSALCLIGLSKGYLDKTPQTIKENILNVNNVDVFIHTWNDDENDIKTIKELFNPKESVFEKQIIFSDDNPFLHKMKSRWYSHKKVLDLKKEYEEKYNFKYDFVMVARFDLLFFTPFIFSEYDPNFFYLTNEADPNDPHHSSNQMGWNEAWFLSNSKTMDEYSKLYDHMDEYQEQGKAWAQTYVAGERVGHMADAQDKNFPGVKKTIDNHFVAKHHAMKIGLATKAKFIKSPPADWVRLGEHGHFTFDAGVLANRKLK